MLLFVEQGGLVLTFGDSFTSKDHTTTIEILMNVLRDKMLRVNECRGEGRRWKEDVVSQAGPEVMLDAGQRKTQRGGSVSAFPPKLIMEPWTVPRMRHGRDMH